MADYNPAVSLGVNSPDPQGGLSTLSKIMQLGSAGLGIQQQKQALQTGQATQQSAQAKASIDTENAKEYQGLAGLMSDPIKNGIVDNDGNPTPDAQKIIMRTAPNIGQDHYEKLVSAATKKVGFNTAVNSLLTQDRTELANGIAGVAARAQSPSDITDTLDNIVDSKKGTPEYGHYQTIASTMKLAINHLSDQTKGNNPPADGQEPWRIAAANIASSMGGGAPQPQNTGAGIVRRDPILGGLSQPPGAATGSAINPTPVQVAAATTTASGTAAGDNARNAQISDSVAPSRQAILLTQQMDKYADMVRTGKYSQEVANAQAALGVNNQEAAARQLMGKTAAQLRTIAIANAPSDTARDTINAGFPDPDKMNPIAIKGADEMIRGNMKMNLARSANAQRFQNTHNGTQGLRQADDQLTSTADGLMYEYQGLKPGAERQDFLQRHFASRDEANAWISRKNLVEHNGGFQ